MVESQIAFTDEERDFLVNILQTVLKDKRVEEHRTRTLSYREHLLHEEDLIVSVLSKLQQPAG
jgi:hypothetical protein